MRRRRIFDVTDRPGSRCKSCAALPRPRSLLPRGTARSDALPYFIDWLLENVHLVEITAYSDDDAYTDLRDR